MIQTSTVTQKGQVTIPHLIRKKMALETGTKVAFILENRKIIVSSLPSFFSFKGTVKSKKPFDIKEMRKQAQKLVSTSYGQNS